MCLFVCTVQMNLWICRIFPSNVRTTNTTTFNNNNALTSFSVCFVFIVVRLGREEQLYDDALETGLFQNVIYTKS